MKQKTIVQIWESYLNGNISWVKKKSKENEQNRLC